jgi:hypothetical protein
MRRVGIANYFICLKIIGKAKFCLSVSQWVFYGKMLNNKQVAQF